MNFNHQDLPSDTNGQSPGWDPKSSKRNSGLFSFLKWFKPSTSRESIDADVQNSPSSSCDSLNSIHSTGTVASFSYVPPSAYTQNISEKCIVLGPETDTYKARLKQRDKRRENDKNLTLRKKYNLFFNKDTFLKPKTDQEEENSRSLPLMTRTNMPGDEEKIHRRTNSESSKIKRAGAYLHVKGKRRAPAPPGLKNLNQDNPSTMSLKRKKRLAPPPPTVITKLINIQQADSEVICNDSLKLDHGILKAVKETDVHKTSSDQNSLNTANSPCTSTRSSYVEAPVSPRPWYKRNTNRDSTASSNSKKEKELLKTENKYEPIERLSQVQYTKNSSLDLTTEHILQKYDKRKDEKRKSGLSFLTNISELDREASEIIKKEQQKNENDLQEIPEFMRPKLEPKINTDSWVSPKRRSARDLIAKFNAITNVTKVTVFGISAKDNSKRDYFGKQHSLEETKTKQETLLESHKKRIEEIDKKVNDDNKMNALMKSESASAVKVKPETPKVERKNWKCPKCSNDNDYWRIICHVCSAIKPYFDDFSSSSKLNEMKLPKKESKTPSPNIDFRKISSPPIVGNQLGALERSKTQIGFSALASYNANNKKKIEKSISLDEKPNQIDNKKEEKEKLKKMLIEMKNSLPKRKSTVMKQNVRTSIISENPENNENEKQEPEIVRENVTVKTQEQQVTEILIGTTQTIYENIKVKKSEIPKAIKVSSAVQTSSVAKKIVPTTSITNLIKPEENNKKKITNQIKSEENDTKAKKNYELMKPKDFENIYSDKNACASAAKIYANLAQNDELSLFFNMPKRFSDIKNNFSEAHKNNNTDTIEINRLLRRLETAIAKGELTEAAIFAKELAQLKINCSVVRQKSQDDADVSKQTKTGFPIEMFVEDKVSHRGPFSINVTEDQTVAELKKQIEKEFEIPVNVQRWILGKELATNEQATLKDHHITTEGCPVFLYLVAPESKLTEEKAFIKQDQPCSSKLPQSVLRANEEGIKNEKDTQNLVIGSKIKETQVALTPSDKHTPKIVNVIPKNADVIKEQEKKVEITETTNFKLGNLVTTAVTPVFLAPKIQPEIKSTVVINEAVNTQPQNKSPKVEPKLVEVKKAAAVVKVSAEIESKVNVALQPKEIQTEIKPVVTIQTIEIQVKKDPPIAKEEEFEDYDASTLKPQPKEWECHLCTLLNPTTSNICAACATIRLLQIVAPKKVVKKKAPVPKSSEAGSSKQKQDETYLQLVNLDNADLVENTEKFECVICFSEIVPKQGVTLRECLHQFCKTCLANTIEYCEEAQVKCPYRDNDYSCNIALQDREIKSLVKPGIYDQYLARSVTQAENKIGKSFHCKTPDCKGWCIFEDNVNDFRCPVCRKLNCLTCQAIHTGMNCKQYQEKMNEESEIDDDAKRTKQMLDEMVNKGEALTCPTCKVILMKKWGCDWLRCSMCKTEICWVTRGPRWGPAGKGDTSGGCQCGVNGVKCHPQCNYCH